VVASVVVPVTREHRAVYVEPQLARDLYGVICAQAFLDDTFLHYLTSAGRWCSMRLAPVKWRLR